ncbi:MAG: hypothetical protein EZS28_027947, partial [Streblomastix strix]
MAAKNGNTDLYIIQTDISGAFNNVVRQQLIDILGNAGASDLLLSYLSQFFTKKQLYHFANGTAMPINSTVGIPQGDPMSPANFSVVTAELINALNQTKAENFNNKNEQKTIYNSSEWLPAVFGYMDDLFITASSKHEAIQLFELAEHHLHQLEMNFNYRKCKALWVHNGKISQGQPIHTQGGDISLNEYLKVLGVPITQSQFIRDREFDAVVNEMCRAADVATLLFSQNALMLERFCTTSKGTRFVQTTNVSITNLRNADLKIQNKVAHVIHLKNDAQRELISLPIRLGGLGIMAFEDIQIPALMATQYQLIQDPTIVDLLTKAGILNGQDLSHFWKEATDKMGDTSFHTGRLVDFLYRWNETQRKLIQSNSNLDQHSLWMLEIKQKYQNLLRQEPVIGKKRMLRVKGADGELSGAHWKATGRTSDTRLNDIEIEDAADDALLSTQFEQDIVDEVQKVTGIDEGDVEKCIFCGSNWIQGHITNCQCNGHIRSTQHNQCKHCISQQFEGIPGVQVKEEEKNIVVGDAGREEIVVPDIVITWQTEGVVYEIERKFLGAATQRLTGTIAKVGLDLTIRNEDSAGAREALPKQVCKAAQREKLAKYKRFEQQHGYPVLSFVITNRGSICDMASEVIGLLRELGRRKKVKINIAEFKKHIMVIIKRSESLMKSHFKQAILTKLHANFLQNRLLREKEMTRAISEEQRALIASGQMDYEDEFIAQFDEEENERPKDKGGRRPKKGQMQKDKEQQEFPKLPTIHEEDETEQQQQQQNNQPILKPKQKRTYVRKIKEKVQSSPDIQQSTQPLISDAPQIQIKSGTLQGSSQNNPIQIEEKQMEKDSEKSKRKKVRGQRNDIYIPQQNPPIPPQEPQVVVVQVNNTQTNIVNQQQNNLLIVNQQQQQQQDKDAAIVLSELNNQTVSQHRMINLTEDRFEKKKQFDKVLVEMQQSNAEILKQLEQSANRRYEEEQQNESTTIVEPEKVRRSPTPFIAPEFDEEQESIQPSSIASSSSFSPSPSQHSSSFSSPSIGSKQKEEIINSIQVQIDDDNFISDQESSNIEEIYYQQQSPSSLLQQQQSKSVNEQNNMSPLVIKQIKKKMENSGMKKKRTVSTNRSKSKKKLDPAIASARGSGRKATPFSALPRPLISELTFKQPSSLVP